MLRIQQIESIQRDQLRYMAYYIWIIIYQYIIYKIKYKRIEKKE